MQPFDTDLLALLCWPVVGAGMLLIRVLARINRRTGAAGLSAPLVILGPMALAMTLVPVIAVVWYSNESVAMLANFEMLMVAFGGAMLWAAHRRRRIDAPWRPACLVLFGLLMIGFGGWRLIGDFLLPRDFVAGRITNTSHSIRSKGSDRYRVWIDGRSFNTTAEVYGRVHTGERVRAEVGAGSQVVLRVEQL